MAKCIQVCALQKRLFALDEEGDISQHHVNANTQVKLPATRESEKKST